MDISSQHGVCPLHIRNLKRQKEYSLQQIDDLCLFKFTVSFSLYKNKLHNQYCFYEIRYTLINFCQNDSKFCNYIGSIYPIL